MLEESLKQARKENKSVSVKCRLDHVNATDQSNQCKALEAKGFIVEKSIVAPI